MYRTTIQMNDTNKEHEQSTLTLNHISPQAYARPISTYASCGPRCDDGNGGGEADAVVVAEARLLSADARRFISVRIKLTSWNTLFISAVTWLTTSLCRCSTMILIAVV